MARLELQKLAEQVGILPGYIDDRGKRVVTGEEARARVLTALGFEVGTAAACHAALDRLRAEKRERAIDRVRVVVGKATLPVRSKERGAWRLTLAGDNGGEPVRLEGKKLG